MRGGNGEGVEGFEKFEGEKEEDQACPQNDDEGDDGGDLEHNDDDDVEDEDYDVEEEDEVEVDDEDVDDDADVDVDEFLDADEEDFDGAELEEDDVVEEDFDEEDDLSLPSTLSQSSQSHPSVDRLSKEEVTAGLERMRQYNAQGSSTSGSPGTKSRFANKAPNEDCTMESWRQRKKHVFVFSNAGKPVFSRYGDEHLMSTFFAAAQAILSFASDKWSDKLRGIQACTRKDSSKTIQHHRGGFMSRCRKAIFLEKGPLTFLCVSGTVESADVLRSQLELLHGQFVSILTLGIEKAFVRSANFDMRQLLGGTGPLLRSVVHSGAWELPVIFGGMSPLPLELSLRKAVSQCLQGSFVSDLMCAMVFTNTRLICISSRKKFKFDHNDIFLFTNFVRMNESFKQNESFTPFCFPSFNPDAFLYVYVSYISQDVCLALISARADSFHELAQAKEFVQGFFKANLEGAISKALQGDVLKIRELPLSAGGGTGFGTTPLWHYVYFHKKLRQQVSPDFGPPLHQKKHQKMVLQCYQQMVLSLKSGSDKHTTVSWKRTDTFAMVACISIDFDLYAVFDAIVDSDLAVHICNQLCTWIHSKEADILMPIFQLKSSSRVTAAAKRASLSPGKSIH